MGCLPDPVGRVGTHPLTGGGARWTRVLRLEANGGCRPRLCPLSTCVLSPLQSRQPFPGEQILKAMGSMRHPRQSRRLTSGWLLPPHSPALGPTWLCLQLTGGPCPRDLVPGSPLT